MPVSAQFSSPMDNLAQGKVLLDEISAHQHHLIQSNNVQQDLRLFQLLGRIMQCFDHPLHGDRLPHNVWKTQAEIQFLKALLMKMQDHVEDRLLYALAPLRHYLNEYEGQSSLDQQTLVMETEMVSTPARRPRHCANCGNPSSACKGHRNRKWCTFPPLVQA